MRPTIHLSGRGPLRVRRRLSEPRHVEVPPSVTMRAGALGFAGARVEDQLRWVAAFRRFLDSLDGGVQVLVRVADRLPSGDAPGPGAGQGDAEPSVSPGAGVAQTSEARIVVRPSDAERAAQLLADVGVTARIEPPVEPELLGDEFHDAVHEPVGWHRTFWLARFPGVDLQPGWWLDLVPRGVTADLAWHALPLPTGWMIHQLQRQLAGLRASQMAASAPDVHVEAALPAAESLQRRLAASEERAYRVSLYVTLRAPTRATLETATERVRRSAKALLATLEPLTFEMLEGRVTTLPLGADPLLRTHVLDTSSAVTLLPWRDAELEHPGGIHLGTSRATGLPVVVDPFDNRLYANANIGVFGHSGAGKTFLMSLLALGAHARGAQVFVLDPENEYGPLAEALGGSNIRLALGSGHSLNVLPAVDDLEEQARERALGPAVADAVDLVAIVSGGLDEAERAEVERAARAAYAVMPQPVLRDVAARLAPGRARTILERWVEGSLGRLFSSPTNVDLEASFVVFGMRELRDELIAPVHFLLAEALWSRVKRRDRRRLLVIDELGLLFEDPTLRRFVVSLARRIRKYDGGLLFATQNPGDLLASEAGAVVATNPALHFFGATRPGEAMRLERAFELSPAQRASIESARRGEFLLVAGAERLPITVSAPPAHSQLIARATRAAHAARPPPIPS